MELRFILNPDTYGAVLVPFFPAKKMAPSLSLFSWPSPLSLALLHFVYTEDRSLESSGALFHTYTDHHQQSIHGFRFCCFVGAEKFLGE